jgi:hypothetical protein
LINNENNIGEIASLCIRPVCKEKGSGIWPLNFTQLFTSLYVDLIILNDFPFMPYFNSLYDFMLFRDLSFNKIETLHAGMFDQLGHLISL